MTSATIGCRATFRDSAVWVNCTHELSALCNRLSRASLSSTLSSASANRAATVPGSCLSQYALAIALFVACSQVCLGSVAGSSGALALVGDSAVARISLSFGPKCLRILVFRALWGVLLLRLVRWDLQTVCTLAGKLATSTASFDS